MEGEWRGGGCQGVCSLFSASVSVSGISRGCDLEVIAKPLPWREAGEPQHAGRNAEQQGEARGQHLGIRARWRGGSRRRRIYHCPSGVRGMESFRSGVVERKEDMASSGVEKVGYEGRVRYVKAPAFVGMNKDDEGDSLDRRELRG